MSARPACRRLPHRMRFLGRASPRVAATLAALLLAVGGWLAMPGGASLARAQAQSQPAREAPAPAANLLSTQAERERFHALAEELRCLVCQNQTLADSDAELAADLRREVQELMLSGRTDDEIKAYLVQRYGDFVLYRPPLQRNTWLLWLGPFALLVVGGIVWWRVQRSHRAADPTKDGARGREALARAAGASDRAFSGNDAPSTRTQDAADADLERARRLLE